MNRRAAQKLIVILTGADTYWRDVNKQTSTLEINL